MATGRKDLSVKRLQPVLDDARESEQQAAERLAASRQQLADHQNRVHQLSSYRDEYTARLNHMGGQQGISPQQLRDYTVFLASLDRNIADASRQLAGLEQACERSREQWVHGRARAKGLETVMDNQQQRQRQLASRQEQRETDEHAARMHYARSRPDSHK